MAGPELLLAAAAVSAAAGVMGGVAANSQGKAAQAAADQEAEQAAEAAGIRQAQNSRQEEALRRDQAREAAIDRAGAAESGQGPGGTALELFKLRAIAGERDALALRYSGELEALGFKRQSQNSLYRGKVAATAGRNEMIGSFIGAGATMLGGYGDYKVGKQQEAAALAGGAGG
jgi:hypothetical protein